MQETPFQCTLFEYDKCQLLLCIHYKDFFMFISKWSYSFHTLGSSSSDKKKHEKLFCILMNSFVHTSELKYLRCVLHFVFYFKLTNFKGVIIVFLRHTKYNPKFFVTLKESALGYTWYQRYWAPVFLHSSYPWELHLSQYCEPVLCLPWVSSWLVPLVTLSNIPLRNIQEGKLRFEYFW